MKNILLDIKIKNELTKTLIFLFYFILKKSFPSTELSY